MDRRGSDRRTPPQAQSQEHGNRDHVDVEQIMREIRARISQRHGIELTNQQIQELAARRLEAILDPRAIKPTLLDQLRRSAGTPVEPEVAPEALNAHALDDAMLYASPRGFLTFIRRLLNPILKLFVNPTPLVHAVNTQARMTSEAAAREVARERRQAEWNALHYEILQRLVTEVSRVSLEMQSQTARIESLAAKVDFNERRVRGMENTAQQARTPARAQEAVAAPAVVLPEAAPSEQPATEGTHEAPRRRRRRRRGRRSPAGPAEAIGPAATAAVVGQENGVDSFDAEDTSDEELEPLTTMEGEQAIAPVVEAAPSAIAPLPQEAPPPQEAPAPQEAPPSQDFIAGPVEAPLAEPSLAERRPEEEPVATASEQSPANTQTPPRDEPSPEAPVDRPDPGPADR